MGGQPARLLEYYQFFISNNQMLCDITHFLVFPRCIIYLFIGNSIKCIYFIGGFAIYKFCFNYCSFMVCFGGFVHLYISMFICNRNALHGIYCY